MIIPILKSQVQKYTIIPEKCREVELYLQFLTNINHLIQQCFHHRQILLNIFFGNIHKIFIINFLS